MNGSDYLMEKIDNINDVMQNLKKLHLELGHLIQELSKIDDGTDLNYYSDILEDLHWNNVMLSNRFKNIKMENNIQRGNCDGQKSLFQYD